MNKVVMTGGLRGESLFFTGQVSHVEISDPENPEFKIEKETETEQ